MEEHLRNECYHYKVQDAFHVKYLLLGAFGRDENGEFYVPDPEKQRDDILLVLDILHRESRREAKKLTPEAPAGLFTRPYSMTVDYHCGTPGLFVNEEVVRLFAEVKGLSFDEFCLEGGMSRTWAYHGNFVPFHGDYGELGGCEVVGKVKDGKLVWWEKGITGFEMYPFLDLDQLREYVGKPWSELFDTHGWPDERDLEDEEGDE